MKSSSSKRTHRIWDWVEAGWAGFVLIALVTVLGFWGNSQLSAANKDAGTFVTATRAAINVDMMHDGIRADVYKGRYSEKTGDLKGMKDALNDLEEHRSYMTEQMAIAGTAPMRASTATAYEAAKPEIENYGDLAKLAIEDEANLPEFTDQFDKLEGLLGSFGEQLEADSKHITGINLWFITPLGIIALLVQGAGIWRTSRTRRARVRTLEVLSGASAELTGVSRQLTDGAERTANETQLVSAASEQTSNASETVAIAMGEFRTSISEISRSAHQANVIVTNAMRTAKDARARIEELGDASQEIESVVALIASIAESTNMLALNATIEAARAGEAGKGFAVVAGEVKQLSAATAKATRDIRERVGGLQAQSAAAIAAVDDVSTVIAEINDAQETIAAAVEEQTATTDEVARNMGQVQLAASDISTHMVEIAASANETAHHAAMTSDHAQTLSNLAEEMEALMDGGSVATIQAPPAPAPVPV